MTVVGGRVTVPATSANLGPGFDALGLALSIRDAYELRTRADDVVRVTSVGQAATELPTDEKHLVARSVLTGLTAFGAPLVGFDLSCHNVIPQSRGLGSSAAAIVGGVALAAILAGGRPFDDVLAVASEIEGHPDNAAPAVLGGATVAWTEGGRGHGASLHVADTISFVVFVPEAVSPTSAARAALPTAVPHADAAFNAGRAALLVAALSTAPDLLLAATQDRLHQEQRRSTFPAAMALVDLLRESGVPAVISGAGPAVLAMGATGQITEAAAMQVPGYTAMPTELGQGVTLQPLG